MASVAHRKTHEDARKERKITCSRIFNQCTVLFGRMLPEKRKCKDLIKGQKWHL